MRHLTKRMLDPAWHRGWATRDIFWFAWIFLPRHLPFPAAWHQMVPEIRKWSILNAAIDRSRVVERTMKYSSLNESTYNSSTGLPSPQVLKEYLSHPEEIIGIEHMLSCQKCDRNSLKRSCTKILLDETRRQRQEGIVDPHLLAEKLMITSNISAHMAQQRAAYITLLD